VAEANTYITRTEPTRSALLRSRPVPGADTATVLLDKHGQLRHLDRTLTAGEVAWGTPKAVYQVDTTVHTATFELQVPSVEEAFFFTARVVAQWRIIDPRTAVAVNLRDPDVVVSSGVERRLRDVSRGFSIEDNAGAERAAQTLFARMPVQLDHGVGLVSCTVSLSLDGSTRKYLAGRTHAVRERESIKSKHETTQLSNKLAIEQEGSKQLLEAHQAKFAQEMAAQAERHKLELEQMNMQFYAQALSENNLNLIALRLSTNREDVNDVINLFMRQRELDYEGARGMPTRCWRTVWSTSGTSRTSWRGPPRSWPTT
jgi:regulator of protease activity HflC (stomatin/prohibitin superfamily)